MTKADRRIVIVTFDGAQLLDVVGPAEVFGAASFLAARPLYEVEAAALSPDVGSRSGLHLRASRLDRIEGPIDTLLVAGGMGEGVLDAPTPRLVEHLRRLAPGARRVASVCTGALVLAAAGLLDGRRATTHWLTADLLRDRHPEVEVDAAPIYIEDRGVWTSAGVTAGIDLALALVAADHGESLANDVGRLLVIPGRRTGNQAQYAPELASGVRAQPRVAELLTWIADHPDADLSVGALAARLGYSERHLARVFRAEVGVSVAEHVQAVRLDAARRLLETTPLDVETVARRCGMGRENLHRHFERRFGTTPASYRRSFGGRPT